MRNFYDEKKQSSNKKKQSIVITSVIAILLLITGTFAWKDYRQHKTNVMSGKGASRDVVLVEDFEGKDSDWQEGESVRKKISVRNNGEGDVYVRLKLSEYMEVGETNNKYSNLRYMIDSKGNYVSSKTDTGKEPHEAMNDVIKNLSSDEKVIKDLFKDDYFTASDVASESDNDSEENIRIHKITDISGESKFYIATQAADPNGQYGKHVVLDKDSLGENTVNPENIITGGGEDKKRPDASIEHHVADADDPVNSQCDLFDLIRYTTRDMDNEAADFINLGYDASVTDTFTEYSQTWLFDEESGYFYYTKPLSPKEENPTVGASLSENILESLELGNHPEADFIYQFHVDMEAVSWDEIDDGTWDHDLIPEDLYNEWNYIDPNQPKYVESETDDGFDKIIVKDNEGKDHDFRVIKKDGEFYYVLSEDYVPGGKVKYRDNNITASPFYTRSVLRDRIVTDYEPLFSNVIDSGYIVESYMEKEEHWTDKDYPNPEWLDRSSEFENRPKTDEDQYENAEVKKIMFAPSVSDIAASTDSDTVTDEALAKFIFKNGEQYWLSTVAESIYNVAYVGSDKIGYIGAGWKEGLHARAAMWVKLDKY